MAQMMCNQVFSAGDVENGQEIGVNMDHLDSPNLNYYKANILVYICGYIVNKLIKKLSCKYCIKMLLNVKNVDSIQVEHNYSINLDRAYKFTKAVDLGGLKLPSLGVLEIVKKEL
uniref:Uncharacterized protein n=1 Tax=Cacopsylla melanoneura TaxID=428564 RepID=A0A8D8QYX8_9HEMI